MFTKITSQKNPKFCFSETVNIKWIVRKQSSSTSSNFAIKNESFHCNKMFAPCGEQILDAAREHKDILLLKVIY